MCKTLALSYCSGFQQIFVAKTAAGSGQTMTGYSKKVLHIIVAYNRFFVTIQP